MRILAAVREENREHPSLVDLSRKVREGLADVISIHEMLTNQILLFDFETVATPWLQYVRLLLK